MLRVPAKSDFQRVENILIPKPVVKANASVKNLTNYISLEKLIHYQWNIAIGDTVISVEEFQKLVASGSDLFEINNQFVRISVEETNRIFSDIVKREELTALDLIHANLKNELIADEMTDSVGNMHLLLLAVVNMAFRWNTKILFLPIETMLFTQVCLLLNFSHPSDAELSGKAELLLTLLESMLERREKVLIFSQYTEMIAILQEIIEQKLRTIPLTLTG